VRRFALLALAPAIMLGACSDRPEGLVVKDAKVRLSANPAAPSVGYLTIEGGPTADRLISVTSPLVVNIELHDHSMEGGMMKMTPITGGVDVPANGRIEFKEGGKHLMLNTVNPSVKPGMTIQMNFTFASGTILQTMAPVSAPGS
jgi:periplasmic copper chaperone A